MMASNNDRRTLFSLGEWVIETKNHRHGEIIAIIPAGEYSITDLYVVQFSDGVYEIFDYSILVVYDKYYWDDLQKEDQNVY